MNTKLYSKLSDLNLLFRAWQKVRKKKSLGGIDNVSIYEFEAELDKNLKELSVQISDFTYISEPYKTYHIKKKKNETRKLAMVSVKDKILQNAVKEIIEPRFEKHFPDISYGYRPGKNTTKAIKRVLHFIKYQKSEYTVTCDIDDFFDEINIELLLKRLNAFFKNDKIVALIEIWLRIGEITDNLKWNERKKGIAQGSVLAPLLSNFYMQTFDMFMLKHEIPYLRYSDNFILLANNKSQLNETFNLGKQYLSDNLFLKLNRGSNIKEIKQGFDFLGISFKENKLSVSAKKKEELKAAISQSFQFKKNKLAKKFHETNQGIANYYAKLLEQNELEDLDLFFKEIIKTKTEEFYYNNIITNKKKIKQQLENIQFYSLKGKSEKQKTIDEVINNLDASKIKTPDKEKKRQTTPKRLIKKKKKEYQKLEAANHDLIVKTPGVFVGKSNKGVYIKKGKKKLIEMQLKNLENIVITAKGVSLSSDIIRYCSQKNTNILFLEFTGKPYALLHGTNFNNAQIGLAQLNAVNNGKAIAFICSIVRAKIKNQINLIKYNAKYRLSIDEEFEESYNSSILRMKKNLHELKNMNHEDYENEKNRLFTIEGRAAAVYWQMVEKILDEYTIFEGRKHQRADDLVNAMLNYGYGILYSRIWTALLKAGLNPYISYLHTTKQNDPALVFDFIEQFRQQAVDRAVFAMISRKEMLEMENGKLNYNARQKLAKRVIERLNNYENYNGKEIMLGDIINEKAKQLADYLLDKKNKFKPYISKW